MAQKEIQGKTREHMPRQKQTGNEISIGDLVEIASGEHWGSRARVITTDRSKGTATVELVDALVPMVLTYERHHLKRVNGSTASEHAAEPRSDNAPPVGSGIERVGLYIRSSSSDYGPVPARQIELLKEYAAVHKWSIAGEYSEKTSDAKEGQPALMALLADARQRRFQAILTPRLGTLSGSARDVRVLLEEFRRNGIALICTDQELEISGIIGEAVLKTMDAVSELSREPPDRSVPAVASAGGERKRRGRKRTDVPKEMLHKAYQDARGNLDHVKRILSGQGIEVSTWLIRHRLKETGKPQLEPLPGTDALPVRTKRKRFHLTDEMILAAYKKGGCSVKGARDALFEQGITPSYSLVYLRLKRLGKAGLRPRSKGAGGPKQDADIPPSSERLQ